MALKLLKRGKVYYVRGTVCGVHVYTTTKLTSRNLAEAARVKLESRLMHEAVFGAGHSITFADAAELYRANGGSARFLDRLCARFERIRLSDIRQTHLDQAARELYPTATPETRNRQVYTPFIAVWNYAARSELVITRTWSRPRKQKGTNVQRRELRAGTSYVPYDRATKFVAEMSPAPAMVMTALFFTGMRPIELYALQAEDVNIAGRWITVRTSKTGEPRGVPLHEFLVPMMTELVAEGGFVFKTHKGRPYPPLDEKGGRIKSAINGARRRSKITDISPYTARHTVSTQLVMNGVHPHIKDQILGHAADSMSRHYTSVPQQPLIDAINTITVPEGWPRWESHLEARKRFVKWGKS